MKRIKNISIRLALFTFFLFAGSILAGTGTEAVNAQQDYNVNGDVIAVSTGSADAINQALEYARANYQQGKIYTVKVPAGDYELTNTLYIWGNTTLDLTGVTLRCKMGTGKNMLRLGKPETADDPAMMEGYGTAGNVTVKGGTWIGNDQSKSSLLRMAHASRVTFDGCVVSGGNCEHQMELAAIDGLTIKKCTFKDMAAKVADGKKREALQLDMPCSSSVFQGAKVDGTPMKNVTITGCTFKNVPRGLGSHNMLVGVYHRNIKINNNIFENVDGECIVAVNYKNCTIQKNKIKNCGAGILFQNFKANARAVYSTIFDGKQNGKGKTDNNANATISDNDITLSAKKHADEYVGIKIYGFHLKKDTKAITDSKDLIPKGNYAVKNITISNNKIKTCGHGIHLMDAVDAKISGNTIESTKAKSDMDGLLAEYECEKLVIRKNTIKKAARYGIFVQRDSEAKEISGNKIVSCGKYGIGLYDGSKVTKGITGNIIENSKSNAIFVNHKCIIKSIQKNKIKNSGGFGIGLYDASTVSSEISGNKIDGCKSHGISISLKCYAKKISGNTVKNAATYPIVINTSSKKTITVTGNNLTAKKGNDKIHVINGVVKK